MVFSGRIDNSNHPLGAGMEVDVLNLNGLLVTSPMSVEGLDQIELIASHRGSHCPESENAFGSTADPVDSCFGCE